MDISLNVGERGFRDEVRAFLEGSLSESVRRASRYSTGVFVDPPWTRPWHLALYEKGWITPSWPVEFGGCDWTPTQRYIFDVECAKAGAPIVAPMSIGLVGPVIVAFGSDWQKSHFLPRIRSGEDYWCQGFSEPGSGSDLSSLKAAADRVGDEYVVNGSKIWTTHGHFADMMFALVRTSREEHQQQGISFLLIDMRSPGLEVRPIITIGGDHEVNQVFFDNVRVPATNLVGEPGRGWDYAKYLLEFERGGGAPSIRCRIALDRHREILRQANGDGRLIDHEDQQIEYGRLEAETMALEILDMRQVAARQSGERPGPAASVVKTLGSELLQKISQASINALGLDALPNITFEPPDFTATNDIPIPECAWAMTRRHLNGLAGTIFGGASEIQRDIIARMVID